MGPVFHSIADSEHPLLCLLGPRIVSQERALSGSFPAAALYIAEFLWVPHCPDTGSEFFTKAGVKYKGVD